MKHFLLFLFLFPVLVFAQPNSQNFSQPSFRLGAQVGYGYRIGEISRYMISTYQNEKQLRNNVSFGTDFSYYFNKNIGFGIKYNGVVNSTSIFDNYYEKFLRKVNINYLGAFFGVRFLMNQNRNCLFANSGVGYVNFRDNIHIINGNSYAFLSEIGFDFFVTKYFALGLQVSLSIGALENIYIENKKISGIRENLTHVDISLGFRFYK